MGDAVRGCVTDRLLGVLAGRIERLEIRCTRCDRTGRVKLAKLIEDHGPEMGLPDLAVALAANCPKIHATSPGGRCFVVFPQLVEEPAGER